MAAMRSPRDADVGRPGGGAAAVDEQPAADQEVERHSGDRTCGRRPAERGTSRERAAPAPPGGSGLGDHPERDAEPGPALERAASASPARPARRPGTSATHSSLKRVELGRVARATSSPTRSCPASCRPPRAVAWRLRQALPRLLLDRRRSRPGRSPDRSARSTRRRPSRRPSTTRPRPTACAEVVRRLGAVAPPQRHFMAVDAIGLAGPSRRDAELARRQLDAVRCELGHERRPDARSAGARPRSCRPRTPVCSNAKMSWVRISSSSIP